MGLTTFGGWGETGGPLFNKLLKRIVGDLQGHLRDIKLASLRHHFSATLMQEVGRQLLFSTSIAAPPSSPSLPICPIDPILSSATQPSPSPRPRRSFTRGVRPDTADHEAPPLEPIPCDLDE